MPSEILLSLFRGHLGGKLFSHTAENLDRNFPHCEEHFPLVSSGVDTNIYNPVKFLCILNFFQGDPFIHDLKGASCSDMLSYFTFFYTSTIIL